MMARGLRFTTLCFCAALSLSAGCSVDPTYKRESLVEDVKSLAMEQGLEKTEVKLLQHTLAVHVDSEGSLVDVGRQIGIGPKFDEIGKAIFPILHRVIMSTDAGIQFYVLLLTDPNIPGAYLMMIRSVEDIRKLNVSLMNIEEFISRTIMELNYLGPKAEISLETNVQRDITLSEFLSWQLSRRIQSALVRTFAQTDAIEVGRCLGEFFNDTFIFTLNVVPTSQGALSETTVQSAFDAATDVIESVLGSYKFDAFDNVRLIHHPTGRHLLLPKDMLHLPMK